MKKEPPKRCELPKNNKNSSHGNRYNKETKKGEKIKSEKYMKSLTT